MTHQTDRLAILQSPEYQAHLMIWKIWPPCIFLLGAFGNIATIFVMRRIKDHNSSHHTVLMVLAVSDLILLCSATATGWLRNVFRVDVHTVHVAVCKVLEWTIYVVNTTSAWLVTCVTVQRTMAVLWPHRMRVMCTVRRTWIVIVILVLTACALDFHLVVGLEINAENRCFPMPGMYQYFLVVVFSWVDLCATSIGPSLCMFVCNVTMSVTLFKAASSSPTAVSTQSESSAHNSDSRRKTSHRTTVMVLTISSAFLVLTVPNCAYLIWFSFSMHALQDPKTGVTAILLRTVALQLWFTNSAINFFLYCLTGTKFRREFISWIRCGTQSPSAPSVRHTASSEIPKGRRLKQHGNSPLSKKLSGQQETPSPFDYRRETA
ncbi:hypothetical protein ACOMHN_010753 [Nucella lapillus]